MRCIESWKDTAWKQALTMHETPMKLSNPNGLLSQKLCHYLDQGRKLNDILLRAAHWLTHFDISKLNLA